MEQLAYQILRYILFLKQLIFPNIKVLLTILATLPDTTCVAERLFSSLKRTKTSLWSSMTTSGLTNLTHLHIFRNIEIDVPSVMEEFSQRHRRKIHLSSILSSFP
uniref:HAT C-terminal dimerisation domain-containing protein n=1 Tax=Amphimedon queenslandica TaxID=400682 RepID=A0A1X7VB13_AMPQE